ncbi:unnamed protein product [Linum tenue]|uniref:Cytochrome P450 n=2 Tax=Linum tenue TaxID=586396 RepID=A0AAV0GPT0_9ROSI|nr:unnamed protein product [Linum tenue]
MYIFNKMKKKKNRAPCFPLPPGPWNLPIIGNIHQLAFSSSTSGPVHRRLAELAQHYGPIMQLKLGETYNVVVSSPESARAFLKTHDHEFPLRPYMPSASIIFYGGKDIVFSPVGDHWRRMKKLCTTELLSEKRVRSLRPVREEEVGKLMKLIGGEAGGGGAVNLSRLLFAVSNMITSRTAFGTIRELEGSFLPVIHQIVQTLGGFSIGDIFPSNRLLRLISGTERHLKKLHQEADSILQGIIDEHVSRKRRRRETEDHDMAEGAEEDDNDDDDLTLIHNTHTVQDVFVAAGDSSPIAVEWTMSELMKNPEKMEKVQREVRHFFDKRGEGAVVDEALLNELKYLKSVVKETFRLHPPAALSLPREGPETVVVNGYQIPSRTRVIVNYWAIGRDPSHWTQPNQFIPERFLDTCIDYRGFDFQLLPFGSGRRVCPGMNYGTAVVYSLLANLLYRFNWELPNQIKPQDLDMSENFGGAISRKKNLYLIPIPYHAP